MKGIGLAESMWLDLRYATRVLRKSPGFALVAILSLTLGIGANSAVFSVIHGVLLRPLPYPEPDRLVRVGQQGSLGDVSIPEFEFWKQHASSFETIAGNRGGGERNLSDGARQQWISTMMVTADFFRTLGLAPALGREFNTEETHFGGPQAIILSDALWRRVFNADHAAVGRMIALDGASFMVVGVLPRDFWFPQSVDAFIPLRPTGGLSDTGTNTQMLARLKQGVTLGQAQSENPVITESMRRTFPDRISRNYRGLEARPYQEWLVGDVRLNLLLLFGAAGILLLIACSNLASLLLARLAARRREVAMRVALGSGRARLLRQFLTENLLLTFAGAIGGLAAARVLLAGLMALMPFRLPASSPIRLDAPVLAFTLAIAFATGLAFSLAPILSGSQFDLYEALKTGGRGVSGARQRTRSVLVIAEVSLAVMLLVSAGLLMQSLYRMHQEQLGFSPEGRLTLATPIAPDHRRSSAELWRFESAVLERLETVPGVRGVAAINVLPLNGYSNLPTQREGHAENSIGGMEVRTITPAYFAIMGIALRRGRSFTAADTQAGPPVVLVNETLARRWWPDGRALGDRVVIGRFRGRDFGEVLNAPREVVGIVADAKSWQLKEPALPTVYIPIAQLPDGMARGVGGLSWVVRAAASPGLAGALRSAITEMDPRQRVRAIRPMEEIVAATTAGSKFDAWLFGFFAGLALLLTAVGIYGLLAYSVARRTSEIGTRMALGATRASVLRLIMRQGLGLIGIGLGIGIAGALAVTRLLTTLLFGVRPTDPLSFAAVAVLLLGVGSAASYFPARRAMQVDPMSALRCE